VALLYWFSEWIVGGIDFLSFLGRVMLIVLFMRDFVGGLSFLIGEYGFGFSLVLVFALCFSDNLSYFLLVSLVAGLLHCGDSICEFRYDFCVRCSCFIGGY